VKAQSFVHEGLPGRVVFGSGTLADVSTEAERLGIRRPLILSTRGQQPLGERVRRLLNVDSATLFAGAKMHTPVEVTERAMAEAKQADGLIAIGGGSTIGLAKAIALRTDLPQIAVPTTYAGSEMTPILGQSEEGLKTTLRDPRVLPETVIYDVDLTLELPWDVTITSAMNAIAHAGEALYARDGNPFVSMIAEEAVRAIVAALPRLAAEPLGPDGRAELLYGAWMSGICLASAGMALHHKLCHTLGGSFDLPHAPTHCVVLPHVLAFNLAVDDEARVRLARATGSEDPALALHHLARAHRGPVSLRELGLTEDNLERAARLAIQNPYWNPRPFDEAAIFGLLRRAWNGEPPRAD
jgi:maleylacetate reductase